MLILLNVQLLGYACHIQYIHDLRRYMDKSKVSVHLLVGGHKLPDPG